MLIIRISAAVLSAIQTFLKYSEKAEKHRSVGAKAGSLRRQIEQYIAAGNVETLSPDKINAMRQSIDKLAEDAPNIPNRIWERAITYLDANP